MDFEKWVKSIQTAGSNSARTVHKLLVFDNSKVIEMFQNSNSTSE